MHAIIPAIDIILIRTVFIVDVHATHLEALSGCLDHLYDMISSKRVLSLPAFSQKACKLG
jgi:hypothetical protein